MRFAWKPAVVAAAVTITLLTGSVAAATADTSGAGPLAVYFNLKPKSAPTKCLDVAGGNTGSGATVQQWACLAGTMSQQWELVDVSGYNQIKARHSGRCLTVAEGNSGAGAAILQSTCVSGAAHQLWSLASVGSGQYNLKAKHSARCVNVSGSNTVDGANVQQWTCLSGNTSQIFALAVV